MRYLALLALGLYLVRLRSRRTRGLDMRYERGAKYPTVEALRNRGLL